MSSKVYFNKSPISDTTELQEALWRAGSEFAIITTPVIDDNHSSVS